LVFPLKSRIGMVVVLPRRSGCSWSAPYFPTQRSRLISRNRDAGSIPLLPETA
jgi:uncharacterized membrane protein